MVREKQLTAKQREVLDYLVSSRREGRAPTFREIAEEFGIDVKSAYQRVRKLEQSGLVSRPDKHSHRGLELSAKVSPTGDARSVPVLGRVAAGAPILAVENMDGYSTLPDMFGNPDGVFLLKVQGDSMIDDGIWDGDYVVVRSAPMVRSGEIAVVIIDEDATVKRVHFETGRLRLQPANEKYEPMYVERAREDVRVAGKVVGVMRTVR
jgi:repressor LexA